MELSTRIGEANLYPSGQLPSGSGGVDVRAGPLDVSLAHSKPLGHFQYDEIWWTKVIVI
jgi:hypothetical protein